jgi:S-adenosylmethionine:tRNA ribosyltransferase-isomerase
MKLSEFKYSVPQANVAQDLASPRDASRMLILDKETGNTTDKMFQDLLTTVNKGDCIVINETMVFPARMYGNKEKTNAEIEVMLLRELNKQDRIWDVLVEPARKVRIGNKIYFDNESFYCEVIDNTTNRGRTVRFSYDGNLFDVIKVIGEMPLPSYIKRKPDESDKQKYQSVFANPDRLASIAPPSGSLHFTQEMLDKLEEKGVRIAKIVLHIGQGIFEKIEVEDLTKHRMYSEYFEISMSAAEAINKSLASKKNIYAVGSSTVRALESSVLTTGKVKPNKGWTDKYIYPPYDFKIVSGLITNFQPSATPSLLVSAAFAGKEKLFNAYKYAIKNKYRMLVYGDAILIR